MNIIKKTVIEGISLCIKAIRPILGYPFVCLYPVNCMIYAESMLRSRPWHYAIPAICFRVVGCNPITGGIWWLLHRRSKSIGKSLEPL